MNKKYVVLMPDGEEREFNDPTAAWHIADKNPNAQLLRRYSP